MTQITGAIVTIKDAEQVTEKFKKRGVVIQTEDQYPQKLYIEFINDRCSILDSYKEGERVNINLNLRGREWVDPSTGEIKYFNSFEGWRIEYANASGSNDQAPRSAQDLNQKGAPGVDELAKEADDDDLPF